jgi:hypothetical protein
VFIELRECLLTFGPESLFSSFIPKSVKIDVLRITVLRVVLYGCETWYVILKEGYRLRDFENGALKKISGRMWSKVRGE